MKAFLAAGVLLLIQQESHLRVAWGPIRTIDPALAVSLQDRRVVEVLFPALPAPKVDGRTLTYAVPDLRWSDGRPVTADDFRFAWFRCLTPSGGSPWAFLLRDVKNAREYSDSLRLVDSLLGYENLGPAEKREILETARAKATKRHAGLLASAMAAEKDEPLRRLAADIKSATETAADVEESHVGIEAVNVRTLKVTLDGTAPPPPSMPALSAVPRHVVESRRVEWIHPQFIATCGAYAVEKFTRDDLVLRRVGRGAAPDKVTIRSIDRAAEAWPLYERGEVDWVDRDLVPPEKIAELKKSGELRMAPTGTQVGVRLNLKGPLEKKPIRVALAQSVDRARVVEAAPPGSVEESQCLGVRGMEAPVKDLASALMVFLAESPDLSKFPRLNFLYPKDPASEAMAKALRDQLLADLAIPIRIDAREWPAYQKAFDAGDYDIALASWTADPGMAAEAVRVQAQGFKDDVTWIPLLREGTFFAARATVIVTPGQGLLDVRLKK